MFRLAWLAILGTALAVMSPPGPMGGAAQPGGSDPAPPQETGPGVESKPARPVRRERGAGERGSERGESSGRGERFGADGPWRPSNEQMDRALELAAQIDPPRGERIATMRKENPGQFSRWFMQNGRRLMGLLELQKSRPDFFKARVDELKAEALAHRLAADWAKAKREENRGETDRLVRELREAVARQVDAGIKARGYEVAMLDERLRQQMKQLDQDTRNQPQLVEQRLEAVMNSAEARGVKGDHQDDGELGPGREDRGPREPGPDRPARERGEAEHEREKPLPP